MKPTTVIAIVIIVVLFGLGIILWQLGVFETNKETPETGMSTELMTPTGMAPTDITNATPPTETMMAPPVEAPPAQTTYTVKSTDTLFGIAKQVYGDGNKWNIIYNANRDKITNKDKLKPGLVLSIPSASGHTPNVSPSSTEAPGGEATGQGNYYTVQKGDTLSKISKKFYNDSNKYDLIVNANHDKLTTKDTPLKPGWKLLIPHKDGAAKKHATGTHGKTAPASPAPAGGSTGESQPQDNVPVGSDEQ